MSKVEHGDVVVEPWPRPWAAGPGDSFLHAIGQIVCAYSAAEWLIHLTFAEVLPEPGLAELLIHKLSLNPGNEPNFVVARLEDPRFHRGAAAQAKDAIERFKSMKDMRNNVVHWVSAVGDPADQTASFSNLIKQRSAKAPSTETYSLRELREYAHDLMTICRDLGEALGVLQIPPGDIPAILAELDRQASLPGGSQPSHRFRDLLDRTK